jgi:hypothetical protein
LPFRWHDANQRVVDRRRQIAAVDQYLVVEHQHWRHAAALVLRGFIAALPKDVEEQDRALPGIEAVLPCGMRNGGRRNWWKKPGERGRGR